MSTDTGDKSPRDGLGSMTILFVGIVGTLITVIAILFVTTLFHVMRSGREDEQILNAEFRSSREIQANERQRLQGHRWIEPGKIATMPIEDAMKQIADES